MTKIVNNTFDPNGVGVANGNYYGLHFTCEDADLVLIEAPWDVTVSYGDGTANGPAAIREASTQLDLYDADYHNAWQKGIAALDPDEQMLTQSQQWRTESKKVIDALEEGCDIESLAPQLNEINKACGQMNATIYDKAKQLIDNGKIVGLVGGDHSTPYGAIRAVAERHDHFGLLHFDAHRDLRIAYEGFEYSHASIMYNVLRDVPQIERLVQVGVRDFCDAEQELADSEERIVSFTDRTLSRARYEGKTWAELCTQIVEQLPAEVYISFDIDALEVQYCPTTGTPVVGGLTFNEAAYLISRVVESGRRIIGFDLVEVAPSKIGCIDEMVGARMLYKLCCATLSSQIDK